MTRFVSLVFGLLVSCAHEERPESILRSLYADHQPQYGREVDFENQRQLGRYFTPELTALFLKDAECRERTKEICNLDFDPVFAAQDYDQQPLNLLIEQVGQRRFKVTYTNINRRSQEFDVERTEHN